MGKPKKGPREKDLTSRYFSGDLDEDRIEAQERFKPRNKTLEQDKILRTALMRAEEESGADIQTLPIGQVIQVHSLFSEVEFEGKTFLCVVRKTLQKISDTQIVVGDRVRFRQADIGAEAEQKLAEQLHTARKDMHPGMIEQILPRQTILLRADSFKAIEQHPIVANAQQMLIVASIRLPHIKWGLIDRMLIAAQSGGLKPILVINKLDLVPQYAAMWSHPDAATNVESLPPDAVEAEENLKHYQALGVRILRTSVAGTIGIEELRTVLAGQETVLAGHSGVGKSSLINAVQSDLNLRTGEISRYNDKGRHTTTSARRYPLHVGGAVIDTPGVKLFGLWDVTAENLLEFFPDVANETAPRWRKESYERILESLSQGER